MDPNLFHLDYERLFEVIVTIVIMSFLLERALSVLFESRFFFTKVEKQLPDPGGVTVPADKPDGRGSIKEAIALVVAVACCYGWKFDAPTIILASSDKTTVWGTFLTGAIIAGGSKASIKLFRDIMGFMSSAEKERQDRKKQTSEKLRQ